MFRCTDALYLILRKMAEWLGARIVTEIVQVRTLELSNFLTQNSLAQSADDCEIILALYNYEKIRND